LTAFFLFPQIPAWRSSRKKTVENKNIYGLFKYRYLRYQSTIKSKFSKSGCIMIDIMGRKSKLAPLNLDNKSFGQRLSSIRKKKGLTQVELAQKTGLTQGLISDYELDKLRPYHEVIARFALALEVTADELIGLKKAKNGEKKPSSKIMRRVKKIEDLSLSQQKFVLKTIDSHLKALEK
jgi:transcriptional regulator with XRE-family HTH domain